MNEVTAGGKSTSPAQQLPLGVRLENAVRAGTGGVCGLAEIGGLAASALMLIAVAVAYLVYLSPANSRLQSLGQDRARLQKQLTSALSDIDRNQSAEATVTKINESLENFENKQLVGRNQGRMALYNELNTLIKRNSLRNTAGPAYVPLEALAANVPGQAGAAQPGAVAAKVGKAKWQSVYPGIGVSLTVEGQYPNLRHLLRDIETGNQFLVINGIDLESITESNAARISAMSGGPAVPAAPGRPAFPVAPGEPMPPGSLQPRPTLVSLKLDMAAYFQRASSEGALPSVDDTH
jgi:hypothetical protein